MQIVGFCISRSQCVAFQKEQRSSSRIKITFLKLYFQKCKGKKDRIWHLKSTFIEDREKESGGNPALKSNGKEMEGFFDPLHHTEDYSTSICDDRAVAKMPHWSGCCGDQKEGKEGIENILSR